MNFDLNIGKLKTGGKFLQPGIHNATFKGVSLQTLTSKAGDNTYQVMSVVFDIDGFGEWTHNLFPPTDSERRDSQFGPNPSQVEQFMIFIKHLIDTANPEVATKIDSGEIKLTAPNFEKFVKLVQTHTNAFVGETTKIKLIPQRNGFSSFPGFPGRIGKTGELYLGTSFIGNDITLTANEVKSIENAKTAAPTQMTSVKSMAEDFASGEEDDLPF